MFGRRRGCLIRWMGQGTPSEVPGSIESPPNLEHPNEPGGFTEICQHDLDEVPGLAGGGSEVDGISGIWWHRGSDEANMSAQTNGDGGASPPTYLAAKFPSGLDGGIAPCFWLGWNDTNFGQDTAYPGLEQMYVSVWLRVRGNASSPSANDGTTYENQIVFTKLWYHAYKSNNNQNQSTIGLRNIQGVQNYLTAWTLDYKASQVSTTGAEAPGGALAHYQNVDTTPYITLGDWHHIEMYLKRNSLNANTWVPDPLFPTDTTKGTSSPGQDGIYRCWVDGVKVSEYGPETGNGIRYCSIQFRKGFYQFRCDPVWGGVGGTKIRDDYIDWDHVYISGILASEIPST